MYSVDITEDASISIKKNCKKNNKRFEIIEKKVTEISENPQRFKPLKSPLQGFRRVHIDKSFILIYEILEPEKKVKIIKFEHHDKAY